MAENIAVKDLQKLDPGSELVCLYELEYVKGSFIYFMSGLDTDLTTVPVSYTHLTLPTKRIV